MGNGAFDPISENGRQLFQTKPIRSADCSAVGNIAAVLLCHFLEPGEWKYKVQKGSVTLLKKGRPKDVAKWPFLTVFVDYGNSLAQKCNFGLTENPFVVGVELTTLSPFVRHSVREQLASRFSNYADPREIGTTKWSLKPKPIHNYEMVFIERGPCEFEVPLSLVDDIEEELLGKIK